MKKISILCEINSGLDFLPDDVKYKGQLVEVKSKRNAKSGKFESVLIIKVTEYSREK